MGSEVRRFFIESRERRLSRRDVVKRGQRKGKVAERIWVADLFRCRSGRERLLCSDVLFQSLRDDVDNSEDSLKASIEIALAGNLFDAGAAQAVQNVVGGTAFKGDLE